MEWFIFAAPVPAAVDFGVGSGPALVAALFVALAPVALVVRHALGFGATETGRPQLRVLEGGKEPGRRAA